MAGALPGWMVEQWVEYAIGVFVIFLRIYARIKVVGIRGWKGDDYLIIVALFWYTVMMVMHQYLSYYPTNVGISTEKANTLSENQLKLAELGSKYNFVSWIAYANLIWSLKCCMLFFYQRLTMGLWQRKVVVVGWWMLGITYIGVWLALLLHCLPISDNWRVKPHPKCVPAMPNFYVIGACNIVTDAILLLVPIPILRKVKIPLRRKLVIGALLFSGIFIIIATTLNNVLSIIYILSEGKINFSPGFVTGWSARENFVAVIVVNAPCIKPLFSSSTWIKSTRSGTRTYGLSSSGQMPPHQSRNGKPYAKEDGTDVESYAMDERSEELIIQTPSPTTTTTFSKPNSSHGGAKGFDVGGSAWPEGITTTVSFDVSSQQQQTAWSVFDGKPDGGRNVNVTIHGGGTAKRI